MFSFSSFPNKSCPGQIFVWYWMQRMHFESFSPGQWSLTTLLSCWILQTIDVCSHWSPHVSGFVPGSCQRVKYHLEMSEAQSYLVINSNSLEDRPQLSKIHPPHPTDPSMNSGITLSIYASAQLHSSPLTSSSFDTAEVTQVYNRTA